MSASKSFLLIVVPTLDSFAVIPRLMDSLFLQSWKHWRLLFVDGESSSRHRALLDYYCELDSRCAWIQQDSTQPGIFGAMNCGFDKALLSDWVVFLGSDDWLAGPSVLADTFNSIDSNSPLPDLIVCRGRYYDAATGAQLRPSVFCPACLLTAAEYRRALLFGATPPHQATFIGLGARRYLSNYAPSFRLSADLYYFLQLSLLPELRVQCSNIELVHMANAGVSGQQTKRRLFEVRHAYRLAFGIFWFLPFVARYMRRFASLLSSR